MSKKELARAQRVSAEGKFVIAAMQCRIFLAWLDVHSVKASDIALMRQRDPLLCGLSDDLITSELNEILKAHAIGLDKEFGDAVHVAKSTQKGNAP